MYTYSVREKVHTNRQFQSGQPTMTSFFSSLLPSFLATTLQVIAADNTAEMQNNKKISVINIFKSVLRYKSALLFSHGASMLMEMCLQFDSRGFDL